MLAYKAFRPGMVCLGYQFQMGLNRTEQANCRQNGFHCAANPLDCLVYYPDINQSEFYLVDAGGDVHEDGSDSKISCTELTILARLPVKEFFLHGLAFLSDHPKLEQSKSVSRDSAKALRGYAAVCGEDPIAQGKQGDILAFAQKCPQTGKVTQISLTQVDGETIMPDIWYDANLTERIGKHEKE